MKRKRFNLLHSLSGIVALLIIECVALMFFPVSLSAALICIVAALGGAGIVIVSTEVIEDVRSSRNMLGLLSAVVLEFIIFFAFQYGFFLHAYPQSFGPLQSDAVSLLLHSMMIFVFNPLYTPLTSWGRTLLFINTIESLVMALFVLQNVWQFRDRTIKQ